MRGAPAVSSSRIDSGSLPVACAISSRKLSMAKALGALPTPRNAASRAPRSSTTCSASLLGMPYIGTGVPFMTIWSVFGGVPPRAAAM